MSAVEHELERIEALARFSPAARRNTYRHLLVNANDVIRTDREFSGLIKSQLEDEALTDLFELALVHESQRAIQTAARHPREIFAAEFAHAEQLSLALWTTGHAEVLS